jgi:hypothetical protein
VLIDRAQTLAVETMRRQSSQWVLLYQDSLAELWGRSDKYNDPTSKSYVPASSRQITDQPQTGQVTWPALPNGAHAANGNAYRSRVLERTA